MTIVTHFVCYFRLLCAVGQFLLILNCQLTIPCKTYVVASKVGPSRYSAILKLTSVAKCVCVLLECQATL